MKSIDVVFLKALHGLWNGYKQKHIAHVS